MNFKQYIVETEELDSVAEVRLINADEHRLIKESQRLAQLVHNTVKLGKRITIDELIEFNEKLKAFHEFGFLKTIIIEINKLLDSHGKMIKSPAVLKAHVDKLKLHGDALVTSFLSSNFKAGNNDKAVLDNILASVDHHVNAPDRAADEIKNHFTSENSLFGSTRLLEIGSKDYDQIEAIETDNPLYTFVDFPHVMLEKDWHYIVYFLLNLKTVDEPVTLKSHEFRKYIKVKHISDIDFKRLAVLVDNYLYDNDKKLIPEIIELIERNPTIHAANEKRKRAVTRVYRGVATNNDNILSKKDIEQKDKAAKYIATSDRRLTAKNFAFRKGHLNTERTSEIGYIVHYNVTPDAIILDTKILATVYNESEILIDATKATIDQIEEV